VHYSVLNYFFIINPDLLLGFLTQELKNLESIMELFVLSILTILGIR